MKRFCATYIPIDANAILRIPLRSQDEDWWAWDLAKHGEYTVKSPYRKLATPLSDQTSASTDESWKRIWSLKVPPKVWRPRMGTKGKRVHRDQETVNNGPKNLVDVRDVADALLLTYENPQASGRHLCSSTAIRVSDIVNILKTSYPTYTYPQKFAEVEGSNTYITEKLRKLGWTSRPMEETLRDSAECYRALGILN